MAEAASLYRRHRPQSFAEVVGQEHVVRTLSNAVEKDRVHHAYLFVGSRGTGKTSMAKILARSLNCVHGPTLEPCGECEPCRTIAAGTSLDVIEMDAASNRSVDDVRELRERVGFAPAAGRWKVYILDEAHMLTKEAWNAFLKTLEEPPPNTVFVLATTEPQKVMATIVDRCQRFDFQRPSLEQIAEVVRRVADAEQIEVDDGAVALISRSASGSFRDALGTLDQLVAFGGPTVATEEVVELLGAADAELLFDTTDALASGDARAALEAVERLSRSGRDLGQFARDLIAHLRQLLVARATGEVPESFTVTVAQPERLAEQAKGIGDAQLIGSIDSLSAAVAAMREGDDPRLSLEVALLKVATPSLDSSREALLRRIEQLEQRPTGDGGPATAASPNAGSSVVDDAPASEGDNTRERPAEAAAADPPEHKWDAPSSDRTADAGPAVRPQHVEAAKTTAAIGVAITTVDIGRMIELWPAVVDHVRESGSEMLSSLFDGARPLGVDEERSLLRIGFPASAKFNKRKAEAQGNIERMAESLQAIFGARLRPVYELIDGEPEGPREGEGAKAMAEEEIIELLKAKFDASEVVDEPHEEAG
ncbi:MAG: DNA polymerase III subunit gamma/tau [Solirubrobacterales bacterium]